MFCDCQGKGKLARYRPLEFYILQAPALDPTSTPNQLAMCTVWWAQAPGLPPPQAADPIPLDFLAALDHWSLPRCAEMQLVQFGAEGVPLSVAWRPGMSHEVCWLEPVVEKAVETMEVEEAAEAAEADGDVENSVWLRARRKRWADETDSSEEESEEKVPWQMPKGFSLFQCFAAKISLAMCNKSCCNKLCEISNSKI